MSGQSISYPIGTEVWVKVVNRYWWPGIVVDPATIPNELLDFVKKVNPIAVVEFEQEDKYEVVVKKEKICLYSCDLKMEFVKRGLSLLKNQKKGTPLVGKFDMDKFRTDVISMEERIGGDVNIFKHVEEIQETLTSVKQLFTPTNTKKSKKKEAGRKSLPAPKLPKTPQTPKSKPVHNRTPVLKPRSSQKKVKHISPIQTSLTPGYTCHLQASCKFTTNRYDILRRHMQWHIKTDEVTVKKSPTSTSNKRKNVKTKASVNKKIKLEDLLLKDWVIDGEDENAELNTSEAGPSTSGAVVQSTSEVVQPTSEVVQPTSEDVQPTSEVIQPASEVVQPSSKVATIPSEVQETLTSSSNKVFEFNENDNDTPIIELRQSKSDCSSTVDDDISETFESQLTSEFVKNTIFESSPKKSLLAEETHEIHSNKLSNEKIDNQTENTNLLLEKTVNTLDQIENFENSLSSIPSSLNRSDANILTKGDNGVIGIPEIGECESLKKPISRNKDTAGIDILGENMSIKTVDNTIFEETTIDKEIVSNDVEVNESNGTTADMQIQNSCSLDSVSDKIDGKNENSKEKGNLECRLDSVAAPDYLKEDSWESFAHNGLKEVKQFAVIEPLKLHPDRLFQNEPLQSVPTNDTKFMSDVQDVNSQFQLHADFFIPINFETEHVINTELLSEMQGVVINNELLDLEILTNETDTPAPPK